MPKYEKLKAIEPTIDRPTIDRPDEQQNPSAELSDLVQSVKSLQNAALEELEREMESLSDAFTARAVAIVRRGTQQCFLQASQEISRIRFPVWMSSNGDALDGTINTIALPSSTTDGATE